MEWITGINRALRYVEEHLTDEGLSAEVVAKVAAYSPFYLQRLFSILTDMTLTDYIRQRRLSMAGQALQATDAKVLDVALRYGYETPESFHKAFIRFHGVTPSAAKRTRVQLKYLNPLQIQVELTGGSIMDYTVEHMNAMTVVGMTRKFTYDNAFALIPGFWTEYQQKGLDKQVCGYLGICFDNEEGPEFTYMIGAFAQDGQPVPEGFEKREIGAHLWAKFRAIGPIPSGIQKVNRQIFTEWLPNNTEYDLADGINIEYYSEGDNKSPDYVSEIWLPLKTKA